MMPYSRWIFLLLLKIENLDRVGPNWYKILWISGRDELGHKENSLTRVFKRFVNAI